MKTTECSNSDVCSRPEENFSGDHGNKVAVLPSTPVITPAMSIMSDGECVVCMRAWYSCDLVVVLHRCIQCNFSAVLHSVPKWVPSLERFI